MSLRAATIAAAVGLLGATALSTWATQDVAARMNHDPALGAPIADGIYPPWDWITWQTTPWAQAYSRAFLPARIGAGALMLAGFVAVIIISQQRRRRPKEYPTAHGTARFATGQEIKNAGLIGREGLYIGAWEAKGGDVHYLRHDGPEHIAAIAPTRSGKGVGLVVPNLLSWRASAVVLDEKGELFQLTAGWRASIGQRIFRWEPGAPSGSACFNFLDEIRLGTGHETADARNVALMIMDPDGAGHKDHWERSGFALLAAIILHVMYEYRAQGKRASLADVAHTISDPKRPTDELYDQMVNNCHGVDGTRHAGIAAAGQIQRNRPDKERASVMSTVVSFLEVFADPIVAANSQTSDFQIRDLMDADVPVSLYIVLPGTDKVRLKPLARLMLVMIVRGAVDAPIMFDNGGQPISPHRHRALWMFDEFPSFGKLRVFEDALSKVAGFGVTAFLISQDREQLIAAYGTNETLLSNCGVLVFYAPNRWETSQWISRLTGESTVVLDQISESGRRGWNLNHVNHSKLSIGRPLMTPDEVRRLSGPTKLGTRITSPGEMLVLASKMIIKGRQILYFEDRVFQERAAIAPPMEHALEVFE